MRFIWYLFYFICYIQVNAIYAYAQIVFIYTGLYWVISARLNTALV
jgi:hypothetical protein